MASQELATSPGNIAWMLISAALVLLMTPALALFYGGMSRQKSAINMMMMSFGAMAVAGVMFVICGWSMAYGTHSIAGIFANPTEFFGLAHSIFDASGNPLIDAHGMPNAVNVLFQMTFAMIATAIISGSLANRVKIHTWLIFTAVWVVLVYAPMAHMVWGGGLLGEGANSLSAWLFGTHVEGAETVANIAPIDFAGGTVIHINAGVAGLVLALIIGKSQSFMKEPDTPHNLPLVMLGAALLWFGWFGFNGGSAMAADGGAALACLNTCVAVRAAMLGWMVSEKIRTGYVTSLGTASGVVAGLVVITPGAGDMSPLTSMLAGVVGGVLASFSISLKYRLGFDDSLDVVGLHLVAGLWGTIAPGLFATDRGLLTGGGVDGAKLLAVQVLIAVIAAAFGAVLTAVIALLLKHTLGWRISAEEESTGIDVTHHRERAYHALVDAAVAQRE